MQTTSSPIVLKGLLFKPFYSFKRYEPSSFLLFALLVIMAFFNTIDSLLKPDWSVGYAFSVAVKVGLNLLLAALSMLSIAGLYSLISGWSFGQRDVKTWFQLIVICTVPTLITSLVGYLAPQIGMEMSHFNVVFGSESSNITISWLSILAAIWAAYIMAGGIKAKFSTGNLKAWFWALILSFIPLIFFMIMAMATSPSSTNAL